MSATPAEDHPFLTARHVDNLTDAVRALSAQIAMERGENERHHRETLQALQLIANQTENVAGLLSMLIEKPANGATEAQGETDGSSE